MNYTCIEGENCLFGHCKHNECKCNIFYTGEECSAHWENRWPFYNKLVIIYATICALLQFIVLCYALYILFKAYKLRHERYWTVSTYLALVLAIAALMRILAVSIDVHHYFRHVAGWIVALLMHIPVWMWLNAAAMLILYWVELSQKSRVTQLKTYLSFLRPVLYKMMLGSLIMPAFAIAAQFTSKWGWLLFDLYSAVIALYGIVLIVLSTYYGREFLKLLKVLYETRKDSTFKHYIRRITVFIFWFNALLGIMVVGVLTFFVSGGLYNPVGFLLGNLILRIIEFIGIMICMMIVIRGSNRQGTPSSENRSRNNKFDSSFEGGSYSESGKRATTVDLELQIPSPGVVAPSADDIPKQPSSHSLSQLDSGDEERIEDDVPDQ